MNFMKRFFYIVMWVQFGFNILWSLVSDKFFSDGDSISQLTLIEWNTHWLIVLALYIAWRVTPDSKPK